MGKMVGAAEFKAKCLKLIDEMQADGEPITVTKRGKPVAVVSAPQTASRGVDRLIEALKGTVTIHGDIVSPIDPDWEKEWLAKWDRRFAEDKSMDER